MKAQKRNRQFPWQSPNQLQCHPSVPSYSQTKFQVLFCGSRKFQVLEQSPFLKKSSVKKRVSNQNTLCFFVRNVLPFLFFGQQRATVSKPLVLTSNNPPCPCIEILTPPPGLPGCMVRNNTAEAHNYCKANPTLHTLTMVSGHYFLGHFRNLNKFNT